MTLQPGQIVRFAAPEPSEVDERFVVVELRGDRVLVGAVHPAFAEWRIPPTFVYRVVDLQVVEEKKR